MNQNLIKVDKQQIRALIPHSGTMCLLDGVLDWDDETIDCISETHRHAANPLRRNGRLSSVHALEYGAQAAAVHGGLRAQAAGAVAPPGFLAAIRDATFNIPYLDDVEAALHVRSRRLYGEGVNTVYECEVRADGKVLVSGRVTIMLRT
ncbi:MAG: hydroxymyristoyl-ACP dehydratase [Chthoniobacterales bacterium]